MFSSVSNRKSHEIHGEKEFTAQGWRGSMVPMEHSTYFPHGGKMAAPAPSIPSLWIRMPQRAPGPQGRLLTWFLNKTRGLWARKKQGMSLGRQPHGLPHMAQREALSAGPVDLGIAGLRGPGREGRALMRPLRVLARSPLLPWSAHRGLWGWSGPLPAAQE